MKRPAHLKVSKRMLNRSRLTVVLSRTERQQNLESPGLKCFTRDCRVFPCLLT